jgi:microcystin-dependent protein
MGVGEIRLFAGKFAPQGWSFCDGTRLRTQEHRALFEAVGTRYGGDSATFALPDLRGRVPTFGKAGTQTKINVHSARPDAPSARVALNFIIAMKDDATPHDHVPYIAEIRPFAFGYTPRGWLHCDGQTLPISGNEAFFSLIENTFGGSIERLTFATPDLRGAYVIHPKAPGDRGNGEGAQLFEPHLSSRASLLALNYCIASEGYYPARPE